MNYVNKNFKKNSNKVDLISTPPPASPAQQEANINKTPEIPYLKANSKLSVISQL